jgi:TPR repeat protein
MPNQPDDIAELKRKAGQGDAQAQSDLGLIYFSGRGLTRDYKLAVKWALKAAEQGNADAQCLLSVLYAKGRGVPKDDKESTEWLRKAAEQENVKAQFLLGARYAMRSNKVVTQDHVEARKWLSLAISNGQSGGAILVYDHIAKHMTPEQIAEAEKRAREWKRNKAGEK